MYGYLTTMWLDASSRRALTGLLLVLICAGCTQLGFPRSTLRGPVTVTASCNTPPDTVVGLLAYAHALAADTPAQREAAVHRARQQVHDTADARHYARLAIALGTPAQKLYTPDEAARYARLAAEDKDAHWSTAARQYLEDYARLYTELTANSTTDSGNDNTATSGSSDTDAQQQIAQLRAQLADAQHKLRELANIEDRLNSGSQ